MSLHRRFALLFTVLLVMAVVPAVAQEPPLPIPISAEDAFDATILQVDPLSGESKNVVLVDVRTRAEWFWIGAPSKVTKIVLDNGREIEPDMGKARLVHEGKFLEFERNGSRARALVRKIDSVSLEPIARNIPYLLWDEATGTLAPNGEEFANFVEDVEALATEEEFDILIFFCRSGGRSQNCLPDFDVTLFEEIYEIDQPDGKTGRGGFEGSSYGNVYLGYRGFPERQTFFQNHESVSWKDAGLPLKIGVNPLQ